VIPAGRGKIRNEWRELDIERGEGSGVSANGRFGVNRLDWQGKTSA
jgi:hypothetical protein